MANLAIDLEMVAEAVISEAQRDGSTYTAELDSPKWFNLDYNVSMSNQTLLDAIKKAIWEQLGLPTGWTVSGDNFTVNANGTAIKQASYTNGNWTVVWDGEAGWQGTYSNAPWTIEWAGDYLEGSFNITYDNGTNAQTFALDYLVLGEGVINILGTQVDKEAPKASMTQVGQKITGLLEAYANGDGVVYVSMQNIKIPSQLSNNIQFMPKTQFSIEGAKVEVRIVGTALPPVTVEPYLDYEESFSANIPLDPQSISFDMGGSNLIGVTP